MTIPLHNLLLVLVSFIVIYEAQSQGDCDYRSPVDSKTILSGSYGEPRSRHFHAGIDYKQRRGIPYDTIRAVADGYISKIHVRPDGYGNALYIDHPCGQTSVYGHLYHFAPAIKSYIDSVQYRERKYDIAHKPEVDMIQVNKGDYIGVMGSTGRSFGPHLHFEIRDTKSELSINPALLGFKPEDNIAPVISGIIIYNLSPDGQEIDKQYYPVFKTAQGYTPKSKILLTGAMTVGVGIHTYDTMNGATNHNGIYSLNLNVDDEGQYRFKLDSLDFSSSLYIHSHMDYEAKNDNKYFTKCFQNPGNPLAIYDVRGEAGYISMYEYRNRKISITVGDIEGNISNVSFEMRRSPQLNLNNPVAHQPHTYRIATDEEITIDGNFTDIILPEKLVAAPVFLNIQTDDPDQIDLTQDGDIATFKHIKVSKNVYPKYPKEKYCFTSVNDKGEKTRYAAKWESDSTLISFLPSFKKYEVEADLVPPKIQFLSIPGNGKRLKFKLTDNFDPAYRQDAIDYEVLLDGKWILCQHDIKTHTIWFDMPASDGTNHIVQVNAEDGSGNVSRAERSFRF